MDSKALSILIADDHPLFRSALQQVVGQLYPQAELHEAANVAELQQQVELHRGINLLLLDLARWATPRFPGSAASIRARQ